ncbi:MAG: bacterioferritin [Bacteroidetes bacterium QS_8_68_15]|nr:MAG: bacterioferritin [Bacteroidetes bacterium QS_8_68_15]
MDKQTLIDKLNEDLAHEYQAVLMYNTYAAMISGIHRPILRDFFQDEVPDELEHAQFLANKITSLGGTPTTKPAGFELSEEPRAMLEQIVQAESDAIARYGERLDQVEDFGDRGLAAELDDIIRDETTHKEETEKLLRDIAE